MQSETAVVINRVTQDFINCNLFNARDDYLV